MLVSKREGVLGDLLGLLRLVGLGQLVPLVLPTGLSVGEALCWGHVMGYFDGLRFIGAAAKMDHGTPAK